MDFQKYIGLDDSTNYKQELEAHELLMHLVLVWGMEYGENWVCSFDVSKLKRKFNAHVGIGDVVLSPPEEGSWGP